VIRVGHPRRLGLARRCPRRRGPPRPAAPQAPGTGTGRRSPRFPCGRPGAGPRRTGASAMTALLTADRCPACTGIHGQPTDWPRCPRHGHLLYQLRITADGFTYTCPAWKCRHTHTQPERATMTATHENTRAALAIRDGQDTWDGKQLAAPTQLGIDGAPQA